jgi:hypothetical protein
MEMPDRIKIYKHYTEVSPTIIEIVLKLYPPEYSTGEFEMYYHDIILKAKDARITELETFIESRGYEVPR